VFSSVAEVAEVIRPVARTVISEAFFSDSNLNSAARITGSVAMESLLSVENGSAPKVYHMRARSSEA
jgi:hypothetical protein